MCVVLTLPRLLAIIIPEDHERIMRTLVVMLMLMTAVHVSFAQWRSNPQETVSAGESLIQTNGDGLLFGWFDPSRLTMNQSYSLSYSTFGGKGFSLGEYVNSMSYRISDPLSVRMDVSFMHSPYSAFGDKFGKDLTGLRISRAELNYRPSENMMFQVQFRQVPAAGLFGGYGRPWYSSFDFERSVDDDR